MVAEIIANLFQAFMFIGTMYAYFDKKYSKRTNYILFFGAVGIFFIYTTYATLGIFDDMVELNSPFIPFIIFEIYSLIALKGNVVVRGIIPAAIYAINVLISFGFIAIIGLTTDYSYEEIATISGGVRVACLIIVNLMCLLAYIILVKLSPRKIKIIKSTDATAFIIVPFFSIAVMYSACTLLIDAGYGKKNIVEYGLIIICMLIIDILIWKVMMEISKANELRIKYALMEQKEELYSKNILSINEQIEKTVHIKHDMKNDVHCIRELIEKDREEALKYCDKLAGELNSVYTPVNTNNALLNAILNVEQEKAMSFGIAMDITIQDAIMEYANNYDIVSIIGNICDNAIDYLMKTDVLPKKVFIKVERINEYVVIKCRNKIKESVLEKNPRLLTNKKDDMEHGKGHVIVEKNVKKYDGKVDYYEEDGFFCVQILMEK